MTAAHRRLLDMISGWADFVGSASPNCAMSHPGTTIEEQTKETAHLFRIYGELASVPEMTNEEVAYIVGSVVLPMLMRGAP